MNRHFRSATAAVFVTVLGGSLLTAGDGSAPRAKPVRGGTAAVAPRGGVVASVPLKPQTRPVRRPALSGDFNGDGSGDLVLPAGDAVDRGGPGLVAVVYGSPRGPDARTRTVITRDTPGIRGAVPSNGWFGYRAGPGDFDRDGYADLALMQTGRTTTPIRVLYGGPGGLSGRSVALRTPVPVALDDMVLGDFDGNGRTDLVATDASRLWSFGDVGAASVIARPSRLGIEVPKGGEAAVQLVAADFTGDGRSDLALRVTVFEAEDDYGTTHGRLRLGTPGGLGARTTRFDRAGTQAGDVNGDGRADLIAGPALLEERKPGFAVHLGTPTGLAPPRTLDTATPPSRMAAFAVGDVNADGRADLAFGELDGTYGGAAPGGRIELRISGAGAAAAGFQRLTASSPGMPWVGAAKGRFGEGGPVAGLHLALRDLNGDRSADLTIGAPAGGGDGNGVISWLPGTPAGLTTQGARAFSSATLGLQVRGLGQVLIP
ncbi:FG-GAP repeat domain-containing protein [Spirillospora sp. CA-294931]|uniref:FG-GAP repeat domain-containing protein n=1 Tax=Spirillospora sp. CA-294931 TaxID=3240042 RepID=UPI003D912CF5